MNQRLMCCWVAGLLLILSNSAVSQTNNGRGKSIPANVPPHVTLKDVKMTTVAYSRDGKLLFTAGWDKNVSIWDLTAYRKRATLKGHKQAVRFIALSPDGKILASATGTSGLKKNEPGEIKLWDVATREQLMTFKGHAGRIWAIAYSPDGKTIASASHDNTVKLWEVATGKELRTLRGHLSFLWSVEFSPDGQTLASGSSDRTIRLWDPATGREKAILQGHTSKIDALAFSPDSKTLASGSVDQTIKFWDVAAAKETRTLKGHTNTIRDLTFSSDGTALISASGNPVGPVENRYGDIKVWDVATGKVRTSFRAHSRVIYSIALSPDNKTLASVSYDRNIKLWDVSKFIENKESPHTSGQ